MKRLKLLQKAKRMFKGLLIAYIYFILMLITIVIIQQAYTIQALIVLLIFLSGMFYMIFEIKMINKEIVRYIFKLEEESKWNV